ncbi:MAG: type II toxin-antitoxin system RelE/ParE family toxin [Steroidobacteraceae bacterium]|nr:type II toxin-antitoxin system RelE/ParE family toxin [Steroidobacteraceae bacterium]
MIPIRWTTPALADLAAIGEFIAADDPAAAGRVVRAIWARTERLQESPDVGRPGRVSGTRELVLPPLPYIVVYSRLEQELQVISVLHGSQQYPP